MSVVIFSFLVVLFLLVAVIDSVRRGLLEPKYAILWISTCVALGVLMQKDVLEAVGSFFGVHYTPSILFLFGLLFGLIIIFDLSKRVSQMKTQIVTLTQEVTIQNQKIDELVKQKGLDS